MVYDGRFEAWYQGEVLDIAEDKVLISYPGWFNDYDEWVSKLSDRFDYKTGGKKKWKQIHQQKGAWVRLQPPHIPTGALLQKPRDEPKLSEKDVEMSDEPCTPKTLEDCGQAKTVPTATAPEPVVNGGSEDVDAPSHDDGETVTADAAPATAEEDPPEPAEDALQGQPAAGSIQSPVGASADDGDMDAIGVDPPVTSPDAATVIGGAGEHSIVDGITSVATEILLDSVDQDAASLGPPHDPADSSALQILKDCIMDRAEVVAGTVSSTSASDQGDCAVPFSTIVVQPVPSDTIPHVPYLETDDNVPQRVMPAAAAPSKAGSAPEALQDAAILAGEEGSWANQAVKGVAQESSLQNAVDVPSNSCKEADAPSTSCQQDDNAQTIGHTPRHRRKQASPAKLPSDESRNLPPSMVDVKPAATKDTGKLHVRFAEVLQTYRPAPAKPSDICKIICSEMAESSSQEPASSGKDHLVQGDAQGNIAAESSANLESSGVVLRATAARTHSEEVAVAHTLVNTLATAAAKNLPAQSSKALLALPPKASPAPPFKASLGPQSKALLAPAPKTTPGTLTKTSVSPPPVRPSATRSRMEVDGQDEEASLALVELQAGGVKRGRIGTERCWGAHGMRSTCDSVKKAHAKELRLRDARIKRLADEAQRNYDRYAEVAKQSKVLKGEKTRSERRVQELEEQLQEMQLVVQEMADENNKLQRQSRLGARIQVLTPDQQQLEQPAEQDAPSAAKKEVAAEEGAAPEGAKAGALKVPAEEMEKVLRAQSRQIKRLTSRLNELQGLMDWQEVSPSSWRVMFPHCKGQATSVYALTRRSFVELPADALLMIPASFDFSCEMQVVGAGTKKRKVEDPRALAWEGSKAPLPAKVPRSASAQHAGRARDEGTVAVALDPASGSAPSRHGAPAAATAAGPSAEAGPSSLQAATASNVGSVQRLNVREVGQGRQQDGAGPSSGPPLLVPVPVASHATQRRASAEVPTAPPRISSGGGSDLVAGAAPIVAQSMRPPPRQIVHAAMPASPLTSSRAVRSASPATQQIAMAVPVQDCRSAYSPQRSQDTRMTSFEVCQQVLDTASLQPTGPAAGPSVAAATHATQQQLQQQQAMHGSRQYVPGVARQPVAHQGAQHTMQVGRVPSPARQQAAVPTPMAAPVPTPMAYSQTMQLPYAAQPAQQQVSYTMPSQAQPSVAQRMPSSQAMQRVSYPQPPQHASHQVVMQGHMGSQMSGPMIIQSSSSAPRASSSSRHRQVIHVAHDGNPHGQDPSSAQLPPGAVMMVPSTEVRSSRAERGGPPRLTTLVQQTPGAPGGSGVREAVSLVDGRISSALPRHQQQQLQMVAQNSPKHSTGQASRARAMSYKPQRSAPSGVSYTLAAPSQYPSHPGQRVVYQLVDVQPPQMAEGQPPVVRVSPSGGVPQQEGPYAPAPPPRQGSVQYVSTQPHGQMVPMMMVNDQWQPMQLTFAGQGKRVVNQRAPGQ